MRKNDPLIFKELYDNLTVVNQIKDPDESVKVMLDVMFYVGDAPTSEREYTRVKF